jgi:hypothetical protein
VPVDSTTPSPSAHNVGLTEEEQTRFDEYDKTYMRAAAQAMVWRREIFLAQAEISAGKWRQRYAQKMLAAARTVMEESMSTDEDDDKPRHAKRSRGAKQNVPPADATAGSTKGKRKART